MKSSIYLRLLLYLSLAGTLFSGYLSSTKLFSGSCAFNEPCPYFLGYPACYFGFAMFFSMFIVSLVANIIKTAKKWPGIAGTVISGLGVLFAGYFTIIEIINYFTLPASARYTLILPTCSYGLVFFIIIFILSLKNSFGRNLKNMA